MRMMRGRSPICRRDATSTSGPAASLCKPRLKTRSSAFWCRLARRRRVELIGFIDGARESAQDWRDEKAAECLNKRNWSSPALNRDAVSTLLRPLREKPLREKWPGLNATTSIGHEDDCSSHQRSRFCKLLAPTCSAGSVL
jgi:hypothetical protein